MSMKTVLRSLYGVYIFCVYQLGVDPVRFFRGVARLPRFAAEYWSFRRLSGAKTELRPSLHERGADAGEMGEYFWQDTTIARLIYEASPVRHVDVGSLLSGFIAHVATFREIEAIDIRPIPHSIPRVVFRQADMMHMPETLREICDSLSCLHAIEHFGLGRYGDPLDHEGREKGIANLAQMLKPGGVLYLSTPVGQERVEFNANWISSPLRVVQIANRNGLALERLMSVERDEVLEHTDMQAELLRLAATRYALGMFVFRKTAR